MKKQNLINSLDYIKILLEEDRYTEAYQYSILISQQIEEKLNTIANKTNELQNIRISKDLLKTKIGNFIYLNNNWFKLKELNKKENFMYLELKNKLEIKINYTLENENTIKSS